MSSQASWQTGAFGQGGADWSEDFPDRHSVEGLLRRLVKQVEDTERRQRCPNDLRGRLISSRSRPTPRASGASDDSASLDRLHDQWAGSRDAQREAVNSAGVQALAEPCWAASTVAQAARWQSTAPFTSPFAANRSRLQVPVRVPRLPPIGQGQVHCLRSHEPSACFRRSALPDADRDLGKRLVGMAERLEHSVDAAWRRRLDDLTARVDATSGRSPMRSPPCPTCVA
jgi:hypothetical protein